jgi:hypothetical protein
VRKAAIVFAGGGDKMRMPQGIAPTFHMKVEQRAVRPKFRPLSHQTGCTTDRLNAEGNTLRSSRALRSTERQGVEELNTKPTSSRLQLSTSFGKLER